jgi:hypothetical protein
LDIHVPKEQTQIGREEDMGSMTVEIHNPNHTPIMV